MIDKYYIKRGNRYFEAEPPTPWTDGIWIVQKNGGSQYIAKVGEIEDKYKFGNMVAHSSELASFIRIKFAEYIDNSIQFQSDGSFRYVMPSASVMALDILKFLSMSDDEKRKEVKRVFDNTKHIDSNGNIVDGHGRLVHNKYTKEAKAYKILKLKKELDDTEQIFSEQLIDEL